MPTLLALTVTDARNIALAVAVGLVAVMAVSAWLIKSLVTKLVVLAILGAAVFAIWTQRAALQECADKLEARAASGTGAIEGDTTCSIFGREVTVPGVGTD